MFQHTDRLDMSNKRRKHLEGACDIDQSCVPDERSDDRGLDEEARPVTSSQVKQDEVLCQQKAEVEREKREAQKVHERMLREQEFEEDVSVKGDNGNMINMCEWNNSNLRDKASCKN